MPRSLEHKTWWHVSHWDLLQLLYQDVAWFHIFGWTMDHSPKAAVQHYIFYIILMCMCVHPALKNLTQVESHSRPGLL